MIDAIRLVRSVRWLAIAAVAALLVAALVVATAGRTVVAASRLSAAADATSPTPCVCGTPTPTPMGLSPSGVVVTSSPWFNEEDVKFNNFAALTSLTVTIVVQRTAGVSFNGEYDTVGGQIAQASSSTASAIRYTFTLNAGQTLAVGNGRTFAAQTRGTGTAHPTAGDTFSVSFTNSMGVSELVTGHF